MQILIKISHSSERYIAQMLASIYKAKKNYDGRSDVSRWLNVQNTTETYYIATKGFARDLLQPEHFSWTYSTTNIYNCNLGSNIVHVIPSNFEQQYSP